MKHLNDESKKLIDENTAILENVEVVQCESVEKKASCKSKCAFTSLKYFLIIAIIITALIFIIRLTINTQANGVVMQSDKYVIKPKSDFREYRYLKLKNGIEAVLISDPLSLVSGASLSVGVGAFKDPENLQGLAHFCEHMLFLGSHKYPNGDIYYQTITANNGHFNAYTDREITNYFFDIHYLYYEQALDIFSRFFIDPLFSNEKIFKEVNSVNSEYEKNLIIDSRKRDAVFSYLADKENPFRKFTTGNNESLVKNAEKYGLNLREELLKFHSKYYIAEKMKLVLYSNSQLDELEEMVIAKFLPVKASETYARKILMKQTENQGNVDNENNFQSPFSKDLMGSIVFYSSITLENELTIFFIQNPLSQLELFRTNPNFYFSNIFESDDENSLLDILKKNELASKLTAKCDNNYKQWSDFSLSITLTQKGLDAIREVMKIIEAYLKFLQEKLIDEEYYSYIQMLATIKFEYQSHNSIIDLVSRLGGQNQRYPFEYLLDDIHLINSWNNITQAILRDYGNRLSLNNAIAFLPNKRNYSDYDFLQKGSKSGGYEYWSKTNFTLYKLQLSHLDFNSLVNNSTRFTYFPKFTRNLKIAEEEKRLQQIINGTNKCDESCLEQMKDYQNKDPVMLNKTNMYECWYKYQKTRDARKINVILQFEFDKYENISQKIHMLLLENHFKRKLSKLSSKLSVLGNQIAASVNSLGIQIECSTFNEFAKDVARDFVGQLKILYDKEEKLVSEFPLMVQEVTDQLNQEYNSQPWKLSYEYLRKNVFKNYLTSEDYLKILSSIKEEDFVKFLKLFKDLYYTKVLIIGQISEEGSRKIFEELRPLLKLNSVKTIKNFSWSIHTKKQNKKKILIKKTGNFLLKKVYHRNANKNNALLKCYNMGKRYYKDEILIQLFDGIIGNIVFRELRINKQFGYVAKSRLEYFDDYMVLLFIYFSFIACLFKVLQNCQI